MDIDNNNGMIKINHYIKIIPMLLLIMIILIVRTIIWWQQRWCCWRWNCDVDNYFDNANIVIDDNDNNHKWSIQQPNMLVCLKLINPNWPCIYLDCLNAIWTDLYALSQWPSCINFLSPPKSHQSFYIHSYQTRDRDTFAYSPNQGYKSDKNLCVKYW